MSGDLFSSPTSVLLKSRIIPNKNKLIIHRFKIREMMIKQYERHESIPSTSIELQEKN